MTQSSDAADLSADHSRLIRTMGKKDDMSTVTETALGVTPEQFKAAFRKHPAGVAVITATDGNGNHAAMTVSSLASLSAAPPLMVFSVSDMSSSAEIFNKVNTVVVHLLDSSSLWLAQLGATSGVERFADESTWDLLPTGEPYFLGAHAAIRCVVLERLRAGTSTLCVVEALEVLKDEDASAAADETSPLVYHNRTWHQLGDHSTIKE